MYAMETPKLWHCYDGADADADDDAIWGQYSPGHVSGEVMGRKSRILHW